MSTPRNELVDAAVDLLTREGAKALSVRKLAAAVGTSTMAVYTHFGNMAGLLEAMTDEATSRLTEAVTHVPHTDDPVAEFFVVGLAYYRFAMTNPQRYELIMGTTSTPQPLLDIRTDVTVTGRPTDRADRSASYEVLHAVVQRMLAAGRIRDDGSLAMTARLWTICHGAVSYKELKDREEIGRAGRQSAVWPSRSSPCSTGGRAEPRRPCGRWPPRWN